MNSDLSIIRLKDKFESRHLLSLVYTISKQTIKMKPLSAPTAYSTHSSLYPWYFVIAHAPTLFLLHQFPLNHHLQNGERKGVSKC